MKHPWSKVEPREAFKRSLSLATLVGCSGKSSKSQVIGCLKNKTAEEIVLKESGIVNKAGLSFRPFTPTLGFETRISESLQMLIGTNSAQGSKAIMYFLPQMFPNQEILRPELSQEKFEDAVEKIFWNYPSAISETIKFQYTNWTHLEDKEEKFEQVLKLVGDYLYNCPVNHLAQQNTKR